MEKPLHRKCSRGYLFLFFIVLILALSATPARSESVTVGWDPVADSALQGYNVLYGTTSGSYTTTLDVGNNTSYTLNGLTAGTTYYIVTQAYGTGGATSAFSNELAYTPQVIKPAADQQPPTIAITYPTSLDQYATTNSTISLQGSASDNVAVTQVSWTSSSGGSGSANGGTNWQINGLALKEGTNIITVTAYDAAQNSASDVLNITYTAPSDKQPPTITISYPTALDQYATTNSTISLQGSASDNVAVTKVSWTNSSGGSGSATGAASWQINGLVLKEGANIITVTAYDAAQNSSSDILNITYTVPTPEPAPTADDYGFLLWAEGPFGNNVPDAVEDGLKKIDFDFDGASGDLVLYFDYFDINSYAEVDVRINGRRFAYVPRTNRGSWGDKPAVLFLSDRYVNDSGNNTLKFSNRYYDTWGIRNLVVDRAYPLPSQFTHGYGFSADKESPMQATFYFRGTAGNVELNFSAFDVDSDDEVEILINGQSAGFVLTTPNGAWGTQDTVILTDSEVKNTGINVVTFVNRSATGGYEDWGVKDVSMAVVSSRPSRWLWW